MSIVLAIDFYPYAFAYLFWFRFRFVVVSQRQNRTPYSRARCSSVKDFTRNPYANTPIIYRYVTSCVLPFSPKRAPPWIHMYIHTYTYIFARNKLTRPAHSNGLKSKQRGYPLQVRLTEGISVTKLYMYNVRTFAYSRSVRPCTTYIYRHIYIHIYRFIYTYRFIYLLIS